MGDMTESDQPPLLRVGITYNLKGIGASDIEDDQAEYDDFDTIRAIQNALETTGCRVELFEATPELPLQMSSKPVDIVFNIAEGTNGRGREAQIPALLSLYGIPFTGSDETTLCIALDKALAKRVLSSYHIKTPKHKIIHTDGKIPNGNLAYPVIVKPNAEGSSKGITGASIAANRRELRQLLDKNMAVYRQDMLVEEYIRGREFTVGVLGNGENVRVFSPMEIVYKNPGLNIYSYEVKKDSPKYVRFECPANLDGELQAHMEGTALKIYRILRCRDCARIDFRLSADGALHFIEINPLPGLAPGYSDFPLIAQCNGMDYDTLVKSILSAALKRYGLPTFL